MESIVKSTLEKSCSFESINVLIVEDEPAVSDYLKELLCGGGQQDFFCSEANTLASGLARLEEKAPDVVLLDLGLPDSSGMDTALTVRRKYPALPIIVLTGISNEEIGVQAVRMDIQDYLIKGQISGSLLIRSIRYSIERKRILDALRESETNYRGLFDTMTEAFSQCEIILDAGGKPVDFRYLNVNKAWERLTGISADEAQGKTARELAPDVEQNLIDICGTVALSGKPVLFNQYDKRLDKWSEIYIYCPVPGHFASFSRDITAHRKAEEALRESEERMRLAAQAASFGTYDVNVAAGEVFLSPELKTLFGVTADGVSRVPLSQGLQFVHPDDHERVSRALHGSMDPQSGGKFQVEHRIVRTDGTILWVHMRGETFFEGRGAHRRPVRSTGVLLDITDRKRAEEALRESEERYRGLVHAASSAVWRMSADGRTLLEITGAVANVRIEPEKISGDWINYIHPGDRERTLEGWREAISTKSLYEAEHRNLHSDGSYHYYHSRGVPVVNQAGEVREWIGFSVDITERKRAEHALRESEERFRTLADNIAQLAWMADEKGWVFWYNKRWFDYTGSTQEEMRGWGWQKVHHPAHAGRVVESLRRAFETGEAWEETFPLRARDGSYRWFLCRAIPIRNEQGRVVRWFGTNTDITDRMLMEEEIKQMAQHDMLTGLPNRRLFNEIIAHELAQARRNGKKLAVFFLDLDRFKEINDTLGHETGDELLKETAARLKAVMRVSDTVARIGGDEFNVIIPDIYYPEYASEVAQKILNEIRRPFKIKGHDLTVSTSVGISIFPHDGEEIDTLLRYADIAMYHAKEKGRNNYQFYNPVINTRSLERIRFEASLRQAIDKGEFRLYFQPLVDVLSGRMVSAEVLLRWQHPEKGLLEPWQFLGVAEETGFMADIDEWVLKSAGKQLKSWIDEGVSPVCVTVNLSNRQFQSPELLKRISGVLTETGLPAECLDIEITESTAMGDIENTISRLDELTGLGVHVSIDNFGMGYTSLNHLRRLPIRKLKIDRSFIQDIAGDSGDRAIVNAVLLMAHSMKLEVVAEGVEQDDQMTFLRQAHCDQAQGYLISRPMPADSFRELVRSGK
jgi:diguanylate cyclase (GGDEF)-like protein/PAS domain S-box-containing protein